MQIKLLNVDEDFLYLLVFFSIHKCYSRLQGCSEYPPQSIRDIHITDPACIRMNCIKSPKQGADSQEYINCCKSIVSPAKLYGSKSKIKNQVKYKRQKNNKRNNIFKI